MTRTLHSHGKLCVRPSATHTSLTYLTDNSRSKPTFAYASYTSFRPTYSASLYNTVLTFLNAKHSDNGADIGVDGHGALLDLGCGPGIVARALAPHFASVTAVDPSEGMIAQVRELTAEEPRITVRRASVEDLSFLGAGTVDLAVAGAAAHWFDYGRAWAELGRVVRGGGALAFWGYNDSIIVGFPQAQPIMQRFVYERGEVAPGVEGLGRFWEEPGRSVLKNRYESVVPPEAEWEDVTRLAWEPDGSATGGIERASAETLWLRKKLKLGEYEAYIRTYSSYENWKAAHPDRKSKVEGGDGDVVDVMLEEIVAAVPEWRVLGDGWREVEVECVWATCLLMARRRKS